MGVIAESCSPHALRCMPFPQRHNEQRTNRFSGVPPISCANHTFAGVLASRVGVASGADLGPEGNAFTHGKAQVAKREAVCDGVYPRTSGRPGMAFQGERHSFETLGRKDSAQESKKSQERGRAAWKYLRIRIAPVTLTSAPRECQKDSVDGRGCVVTFTHGHRTRTHHLCWNSQETSGLFFKRSFSSTSANHCQHWFVNPGGCAQKRADVVTFLPPFSSHKSVRDVALPIGWIDGGKSSIQNIHGRPSGGCCRVSGNKQTAAAVLQVGLIQLAPETDPQLPITKVS